MKHHGGSERWRQQLGALRAALDQHISAIEAALDERDRDLLAETQQMKTAMAEAQEHLVELTAELAKTRQRLSDVSSAKASLQAQYQQLASQRMTDALSQMLQGREDAAPSKAAPPPSTPAAPTLTSVPAISAPKKPLQFSERARDAKRNLGAELLASVRERAAAVETGDRVAGAVPEFDARRITAALADRMR